MTRTPPRFPGSSLEPRLRAAALMVALALTQVACGGEEEGAGGGPPVAAFTESAVNGAPGTSIQFTDATTGNVTAWTWDFEGAGTSDEQSPLVTFDAAGTYTVRLVASGPGGVSQVVKTDLVTIGPPPTAAFTCTPESGRGYTPLFVQCTDASTSPDGTLPITAWLWDFGDGTTSTEQNPTHDYFIANMYDVTLTVSTAAGSDMAATVFEVYQLSIDVQPQGDPDAGVPFEVFFEPVDPQGLLSIFSWFIDGVSLGIQSTLTYTFLEPGEYEVQLVGASTPGVGAVAGDARVTVEAKFAAPSVDFAADVQGGVGPLSVAFEDRSAGELTAWRWDFGDGSGCTFPDAPNPPEIGFSQCESRSPTHVYTERDRYDVSLEVTGRAEEGEDELVTVDVTRGEFITVYLADASFEAQTASTEIGGAWTPLYDSDPADPDHVARSVSQGGADLGMPTDGSQWAVIEGLGTDGSTAVEDIEHGLRQRFLLPSVETVIELDLVLLYAEPPARALRDAMVATVSDGVAAVPVEVRGSAADTYTPYVGESRIAHPGRESDVVRGTAVLTASLDVAEAFPAADADTEFELTIRTTNDQGPERSPLVYVDRVRFVAPVDAIAPVFEVEAGPFRTGETVDFDNRTCTEEIGGNDIVDAACLAGKSWRWDFDTHGATSPPDATGSAEYAPSYVYDARGDYDVTLVAREADAEGTTTVPIQVYDPIVADFEIVTEEPYEAPVDVFFADRSVVDEAETIVTYAWDFNGFAPPSADPNPGPITFDTTGTWTVTLTITTNTGATDTVQRSILIE